jgi:hypothetical protein
MTPDVTTSWFCSAGPSSTDVGVPFQLCVWDGTSAAIEVLQVRFESTMKPEGVTVFDVAGTRHVLIVDDAGGFATFKAHDVPGWD